MKYLNKIKPYLTIKLLISTLIGFGAGYAYYYFIGCSSGSCPLTSNPTSSVVWGGMLGMAFGWPSKEAEKNKESQEK